MIKTEIGKEQLNTIFDSHKKWGTYSTRAAVGKAILKQIETVQLLGQIEPAEGQETYDCLRDWLRQDPDRDEIFKLAENEIEQAAVLALFCIWTAIFNDTGNYWAYFSEQLGIKDNSARHWQASMAIQKLIDNYPQLAGFPEVAQETSNTRIYRVYLHALPMVPVKRFIQHYLFNPDDQFIGVKTQRERWVQQMIKNNHFKKHLLPFFKHGGRAARAYTRWLMELRESYNLKGKAQVEAALPAYILNCCEQVLAENQHLREPVKGPSSQMQRIADPELVFNPQRFLTPYLHLPSRPVPSEETRFTLHIPQHEPNVFFPQISYQREQLMARESAPERYPCLKIPPAEHYQLDLGQTDHVYTIDGVDPGTNYLAFDAKTGERCDLTQDAPWPTNMYLLIKDTSRVSLGLDLAVQSPDLLQVPWHNWGYLSLQNATHIQINDSESTSSELGLMLKTTKRLTPLKMELNSPHTFPEWVHTANEILGLSSWEQLQAQISGAQGSARLQIKDLLKSTTQAIFYPDTQSSWLANPQALPEEAGLYLFSLDSGIDEVECTVLYLPGADFERVYQGSYQPAELAEALILQLPIYPEIDAIHQFDECNKNSAGFELLIVPERSAVRLEFFKDAFQSVYIHLMCRDIRWRQYGQAQMPLLHEMHTHTGYFPLTDLETCKEDRVRLELQPAVKQRLISHHNKLKLQVREPDGKVLFEQSYRLQQRQSYFCDISLLPLAQEAESFQVNHAELGLQWQGQFLPIIRFGLALELDNLSCVADQLLIKNDQLFQTYLLHWTPQLDTPENLTLCFGSFDGQQSFDREVSAIAGELRLEIPLTNENVSWGVQIFDGENFFPSFNAGQAQINWVQQGFRDYFKSAYLETTGFSERNGELYECLYLSLKALPQEVSNLIWQLPKADHFRNEEKGLIARRIWKDQNQNETKLQVILPGTKAIFELNYYPKCPKEIIGLPEIVENNAFVEVIAFAWPSYLILPETLYWKYWPENYPDSWQVTQSNTTNTGVEFDLPPVEYAAFWQGQIHFLEPHTNRISESENIRWQRGLALESGVLASLKQLPATLLEEIAAFHSDQTETVEPNESIWQQFINACTLTEKEQGAELYDFLGWQALEQLSPFGNRSIWELRGQPFKGNSGDQKRIAIFQTHSHLDDLIQEGDFENIPAQAWYQMHSQGIGGIELSCRKTHIQFDCRNKRIDTHERLELIVSKNQNVNPADLVKSDEPFMRLFAHYPKYIWCNPDKWKPAALNIFSTSEDIEFDLWSDNYQTLTRRWLEAIRFLDTYQGLSLKYWWNYRKTATLESDLGDSLKSQREQLAFVSGAYNATCRLWVQNYIKERGSYHQPIHETHLKNMLILLKDTHELFTEFLQITRQPQAFLYSILKDAILAELIMRWYYQKNVVLAPKHDISYFKEGALDAYSVFNKY